MRQVRTLLLVALSLVLVLGLLGGCSKSKGKSAEDATAAKKTAGPVPTATLSAVQPTPVLVNQPLGSPVASPASPTASPSPTSTFQASPSATKPAGSNVEPGDLTHIVQSGDTLYRIAAIYQVNVDDLAKLNQITDKSYIYVGQKLLIPKGGVKPTPTTVAPTPAATPAPATATPTPTAAAPTPTATPTPPSTPTPSPTSTPFPYAFRQDSITTEPNCGLTAIGGTLLDAQGAGVAGYRVVVGYDAEGAWSHTTDPTGGDGKYGVILDNKPKPGRWYVYIIDSGGNQVSPRLLIETTDTDCAPTGAGRQNMKVNFRKS